MGCRLCILALQPAMLYICSCASVPLNTDCLRTDAHKHTEMTGQPPEALAMQKAQQGMNHKQKERYKMPGNKVQINVYEEDLHKNNSCVITNAWA